MKRLTAFVLAMILMFSLAAADEPDGYVASGGMIPDQLVYSGAWNQTYLQILSSHYGRIRAYEQRVMEYYPETGNGIRVPCKPLALSDITGDGIPELIFMEEASEIRGDLLVYSSDGTNTRCVLCIPGITRNGIYDIYMGFDLYLSSAEGGTLVAEYDEYEWPWVLQLARDASGVFTLRHYLRAEYDNSGIEDDRYFMDGAKVTFSQYEAALKTMRDGRTMTISAEPVTEVSTHYSLRLGYEETVALLGGEAVQPAQPTQAPWNPEPEPAKREVYGLTIDKLATRKGPGTQYDGGGTYSVKGQYIKVLSKAWDRRNGIWWVKCEIPYHGEIRVLWTGWKRFDHSTISLDDLPEESW